MRTVFIMIVMVILALYNRCVIHHTIKNSALDVYFSLLKCVFELLLELVTQLAIASTTITIDCTLNGCYKILHH